MIKSLRLAGKPPFQFLLKQLLACPQGTTKQVMGITFKNPIGLAAGQIKMPKPLMDLVRWDLVLLKWGRLRL